MSNDHKLSVSIWGSDRNSGNDDHFDEYTCDTIEEAHHIVDNLKNIYRKRQVNWGAIYIDDQNGNIATLHNGKPVAEWDHDHPDNHEAYLIGMGQGIQAHNDARNQSLDEPPEENQGMGFKP